MKAFAGTILTVDMNDSICRYIVEDKGRIVYFGHALPDRYRRAEGKACRMDFR